MTSGRRPETLSKKSSARLCGRLDLEQRINNFSNQLSGGEQQRVAIARALVNDPALILADEPTGNLDSKNGLQIMRILQRLNNEGHTIVMVTHETYTSEHAKRIIKMLDGKVDDDYLVKKRRMADGEEGIVEIISNF